VTALGVALSLSVAGVVVSGSFLLAGLGQGILGRLMRRRKSGLALVNLYGWRREGREEGDTLPVERLYGWSEARWRAAGLLAGVAGMAVLYLLFAEMGTPYLALVGAVAALVPQMVKGTQRRALEWRYLREIRDFITSLRLAVSLGETISQALLGMAEQDGGTLFHERLRHHVRTKLAASSPEKVVEALARDFRSPEIGALLGQLIAAGAGGLSYGEALRASAERVEQEMVQRAEYAIEEAPTRLVLPMLIGLFPTVVVLVVYPLAMALIAGITSTGLPR